MLKQNKEILVNEILTDFEQRQRDRRGYELKWLLSMNFLAGNQYSTITSSGSIEEIEKDYEWESREVFNHIAPIMETRMSKLARFRPLMSVRGSSGSDDDLQSAKMSTKILNGVSSNIELPSLINDVNKWSEICGTAFYKVIWDKNAGQVVAMHETEKANTKSNKKDKDNGEGKIVKRKMKEIYEGDIKIVAVSPFEIYPQSSSCSNIDNQKSIIHAKAYTVSEIENIWGVKLEGRDINVNTLENLASSSYLGHSLYTKVDDNYILNDSEIVIEKYSLPNSTHENGRLTIIAGKHLLFDGDLPFCNKGAEVRGYPFVKQVAIPQVGCFWGNSIVERLIPIQKAYNAVKNRKYEYMSRISMGVLALEDGSMDVDDLADEGLTPGKILVYRQGTSPPRVMENLSVPYDFYREEDRLLNEFVSVSGVNEFSSGAYTSANVSGVALQIMSEQDETRLLITVDSLKLAVKEVAKQVLMLFKQFALSQRLLKIAGEGGEVEVLQFDKNLITSYDVVYDSDTELSQTVSQRRAMVFDLLKCGLLADETGKLDNRMRAKVLDILGFGAWENSQDLSQTHMTKAQKENMLLNEKFTADQFDDHDLHLAEHKKFYLNMQIKGNVKGLEKLKMHILEHESLKFMEVAQNGKQTDIK